jgi:hypothetical protein
MHAFQCTVCKANGVHFCCSPMKRAASQFLDVFFAPRVTVFRLAEHRFQWHCREGIETLRGARTTMKRNYMVSPISPRSVCAVSVLFSTTSLVNASFAVNTRGGFEEIGSQSLGRITTLRNLIVDCTARTVEKVTSTAKLDVCHSELKAELSLSHHVLHFRGRPHSTHSGVLLCKRGNATQTFPRKLKSFS